MVRLDAAAEVQQVAPALSGGDYGQLRNALQREAPIGHISVRTAAGDTLAEIDRPGGNAGLTVIVRSEGVSPESGGPVYSLRAASTTLGADALFRLLNHR